MEPSELLPILHSDLRTHRIGKWYQSRPGTSIETLCLRTLALRRDNAHALEQAVAFIVSLQRSHGAWPAVVGDDEPSAWTTALATLQLMTTGHGNAHIRRAVEWLIQSKGREANWLCRWKFRTVDTEVKFDPAKYGWPWTAGSTSWVVPTAMSIVALEKFRYAGIVPEHALNERIDLGTAMLLDRMCPAGGWNAGNSIAFGVALTPYIDATAIGLLALQQHEHVGVSASLSRLITGLTECSSPYSIAWGILALTLHRSKIGVGCSIQQAAARLISAVKDHRRALDTSTLAICALGLEALNGDNVFAVSA